MPTKRKRAPQKETASQRTIAELEERIVALEADKTSLTEALLAAGKEAEERVAIYRDRWVNARQSLAESEASLREMVKLLASSRRYTEQVKEESEERSKDTLMLVRLLRLSEEIGEEPGADSDFLGASTVVPPDELLAFLMQ